MKYSLVLSFLLCSYITFAQPGLPGESVDVINQFDAQLLESQLIKQTPTLPAVDTSRSAQSYDVQANPAKVVYAAPKLKPLSMRTEVQPKGYNGYAKLGYGTPNAIFGEAHYTLAQKDQFTLYGTGKHHSAKAFKDSFQRFSTTGVGLQGDYYLPSGITTGGGLGYNQRNYSYYGYDTLPGRLSANEVKQRFKLFDLNLHAFNTKRNASDLDYSATFDFYSLADNFAARERGYDLKLQGRKWIADKHAVRLGLRTDFTSKEDSTASAASLNNFKITPGFDFHHSRFYIKAGANIISHKDSFFILPDLEVFANIIGSQLGIFGGWKGDFEKNTFNSLTQQNPFLSSYVRPFNTRYKKYFGGFRGLVGPITYQIQGAWGQYQNMAFFATNPGDQRRRFVVAQDSATMLSISGSISGKPAKGLHVSLAVQNNQIDAENLDNHYGLPSWDVNLGTRYTTLKDDKLILRLDFFYRDGVPYPNFTGSKDIITNSLADVNLGAQYWIQKNIGLFVEGQNLLNNKRETWIFYPQYGINVLGGVVARF